MPKPFIILLKEAKKIMLQTFPFSIAPSLSAVENSAKNKLMMHEKTDFDTTKINPKHNRQKKKKKQRCKAKAKREA